MNKILQYFLDWKVKLSIILIVLAGLFTYHKVLVHEAVQEAVSEIHIQQAKENFRLKERSLNTQIALQESFDNIQKEKNEKIKSLNSRVASLTWSLQQRPSRTESSGVSNDSRNQESPRFVAADRLYRDDAIVALWFATRTEGLKVELQTCYRSYDEAKETLDEFKADNASSKP